MAVESAGDSSSEVSATVKSDRVEMLTDGELMTGDAGRVFASEAVTDSGRGG